MHETLPSGKDGKRTHLPKLVQLTGVSPAVADTFNGDQVAGDNSQNHHPFLGKKASFWVVAKQ